MLTRWKYSRTSFELATQSSNGETKRKTNSKYSTSLEAIGVSFVKPIARQNPFYVQRIKDSKSSKKRRKSSHGSAIANADEDLDPILCITSSHRVALMGRSRGAAKDVSTLTESKSRTYVSRPGPGTSFDVAFTYDSAFDGETSCGVQYDPASNLLYAIRNGCELAIWTAASSSIIQGPDQSVDDRDVAMDEVKQSSKKRKDRSLASFDRVVSERLAFPEGKIPVTLNPFYLNYGEKLIAVGASGCCDDGSVWIAICRDGHDSFELQIVAGSSMEQHEDGKKTSKRKPSATKSKKNIAQASNNWRLLDSRANRSLQKGDDLIVKVQSALMSQDDGSIILREHSVKVSMDGGKQLCNLERSRKQRILQLSNKDGIYIKFDGSGTSLCMIHKDESGGWVLTSVTTSPGNESIATSVSSIPLVKESEENTSLFSCGCLGQNMYAVLSKVAATTSFRSTLRIVDTQRKVELLQLSWREGVMGQETVTSTDDALTRMLHDKYCRAMITNELDGSLVLVTSTITGTIGVISTSISAYTDAGILLNNELSSNTASLASALRTAAESQSCGDIQLSAAQVSRGCVYGEDEKEDGETRKKLDAAVDLACQKLSNSAERILHFIDRLGEGKKARNGKLNKSSDNEDVNWRTAFYDGMNTIQSAADPNASSVSMNGLKNGLKGQQKQPMHRVKDQPRRYIVAAFRYTTSLLISIHKKSKALSPDVDSVILESIRQETMRVLSRILHSGCLQSRTDCDVDLLEESNAFVHLLKDCPSVFLQDQEKSPIAADKQRVIGALDVLDGMIYHVKDLPERLLVYMVRFLLRNVALFDVIAYYSKGASSSIKKSAKGSNLAAKLQQLPSESTDEDTSELRSRIENKLIAEAVLDFTSKIVVYSKCNLSLLTKSLGNILTAAEVETFLITLSKLLNVGESNFTKENETVHPTLCTRVIDWISCLTDAHMSTILKISDEGSLVVDRIQANVRVAVNQSQAANELVELSDRILDSWTPHKKRSTATMQNIKAKETTTIAAYTIERLVF